MPRFYAHPNALVETDNIGAGTRVWAFAHEETGDSAAAERAVDAALDQDRDAAEFTGMARSFRCRMAAAADLSSPMMTAIYADAARTALAAPPPAIQLSSGIV